jgi:DNA-directed RNA polymerase subunit RPC12/RpoP
MPSVFQNQAPSLRWNAEIEDGALHVRLSGDIDENANLGGLYPMLAGHVVFHLGDVRRINSAGVREWVTFIRQAGSLTRSLTLRECSPALVMQMNMIYNFRGAARVASFYAPYVCPACEREAERLIELAGPPAALSLSQVPEFRCEACGHVLEFDDLPERYLAFTARESTPVA